MDGALIRFIQKRKFIFVIVFAAAIFAAFGKAFAQQYEFSLEPRRAYDRLYVEVWAKDVTGTGVDASNIGFATLVIEYDEDYIRPLGETAQAEIRHFTDSLSRNVDQAPPSPVVSISSAFHSNSEYESLGSQGYGQGGDVSYYSLEVALKRNRTGSPASATGKGSFVGRIGFQILSTGDPNDSTLTKFGWANDVPGGLVLQDDQGEAIAATYTEPGDFTVLGVSVLSPNKPDQVINLDKSYASLTGNYAGKGYPLYFERSIDPGDYTASTVDDRIGYLIEYSTDDGSTWNELGRVSETDDNVSRVTATGIDQYATGDIYVSETGSDYTILTYDGEPQADANLRKPLRVIWERDPKSTLSSEMAYVRITQLRKKNSNDLDDRLLTDLSDQSDYRSDLGRLFFLQLDGATQYLKTEGNFSNSTQLTVEAWVNLDANATSGEDVETGVVLSSGGPNAAPVNGSKEGAWSLYLDQGMYPAFRVRDILGRGEGGYLASLVAYDTLPRASSAAPLGKAHSDTWTHLAATVDDNVVTLYVNGEIVDRRVNSDNEDMRMSVTNHPIWIGVNPNDALSDYLNAGIKGVRVWRVALDQDEIRTRVGGITNPASFSSATDLRRGLQMYYRFEGESGDAADNVEQNDAETLYYFEGTDTDANPNFRPNIPHINLTAPAYGNGVLNKAGDIFEIRWVAYGLGDIDSDGKDLEFLYSTDLGATWNFAKTPTGTDLGPGTNPATTVDVEDSKTNWEPYESNPPLRTINPYQKTLTFQVKGSEANNEDDIYSRTDTFKLAPYFSLNKGGDAKIIIPGESGMNLSTDVVFIEAWINPDRFPTEDEEFMPIITKYDPVNEDLHYALEIMPTGQLRFRMQNSAGEILSALSDVDEPVVEKNALEYGDVWTHVGVYLFFNGGSGSSEIRFYIDGVPQRDSDIASQLGENLSASAANQYATYVGSREDDEDPGFVGDIREVRFWSGLPDNQSAGGTEPTPLTTYLQGAQALRWSDIQVSARDNLFLALSMNGDSFVVNGYNHGIETSDPTVTARYYGEPVQYAATEPYVKLVEPVFKQSVLNTEQNLKIRWVGFDYEPDGFSIGQTGVNPSIEFSTQGGGGQSAKPYQYVANSAVFGNTFNSLSIPTTNAYRFNYAIGTPVRYALDLDISRADPDLNDDGQYNDQGPLSAALAKARLRLTARYEINGDSTQYIQGEGELFTITPGSNFTVRTLLEGYHKGSDTEMNDIATSFDEGGIRITLYEDEAGTPGDVAAQGVSQSRYGNLSPLNRGQSNVTFGNVYFVFDSIPNGNYWVKVEHINHLSVMSRFPAPFDFEGDDLATWRIESGWDYQSWNGDPNNILTNRIADPWPNRLYTAYGNVVAYDDKTNPLYSETALMFTEGQDGLNNPNNFLAAAPAGDTYRDGVVNAADRSLVRADDNTSLPRSDVSGDGAVNATDRTIVDRNFGKVSSIYEMEYGAETPIINKEEFFADKMSEESPIHPELSETFLINASNKTKKSKRIYKKAQTLAGIEYTVKAQDTTIDNRVDVDMYIKNDGDEFALANCTFAVKYNSEAIRFESLEGADEVIFSDKPEKGYNPLRTAPEDGAERIIPEVRTIEVDYDAYVNPDGELVPDEFTYLGTLRFRLIDEELDPGFEWYETTEVYSTDGRNVTQKGKFEGFNRAPGQIVKVVYPNGGEKFVPGKEIQILWEAYKNVFVHVEYSSNGGATWNRLTADSIDSRTQILDWTLPSKTSNLYLVRIVRAGSGEELDQSDSWFAVMPRFAQIVRPSSADPVYRGGKSDKIRWQTVGYETIRFEFSSDAGNKWQTVAGPTSGDGSEIAWNIPKVTTKTALIRIVDVDTGEEVVRSGLFRILSGDFDFRTPTGGQVLPGGSLTRIRWESSGVDRCDLDISTNGGLTWNRIESYVNATTGYLNWDVPKVNTTEAMVRSIYDNDPEFEYDRTNLFEISYVVGVEETEKYSAVVYPNPAANMATLRFDSPVAGEARIKILDPTGATIAETREQIGVGAVEFDVDLTGLHAGIYYAAIELGGESVRLKFAVVR